MTEKRTVVINGVPCSVTISDDGKALSSAYAAGGAVIGIWDRRQPDRSLAPAEYVVEDIADADEEMIGRVVRRRLGLPWIIAETERLVIREFATGDLENMARGEEQEGKEREGEEDRESGEGWEEAEGIFQEAGTLSAYVSCQYRFYEYGIWALEEKRTGQIVGRAGLFSDTRYPDKKEDIPVELGYRIFLPWRRKGFAKEACAAILEYASSHGMERVCAVIGRDNLPSLRLAEALGFQITAQARSEAGREMCLYVWNC